MTEITFHKTQHIGSSYYGTFNTVDLSIKTLQLMLKKLSESEKESKDKITTAINKGQYKRSKGTIYFVPPIIHNNIELTHIVPSKVSTGDLNTLYEIASTSNLHNEATIRKLGQELVKRKNISEAKKRERDDTLKKFFQSEQGQKMLPLKKRFVELVESDTNEDSTNHDKVICL